MTREINLYEYLNEYEDIRSGEWIQKVEERQIEISGKYLFI